MSDFEPTHKVIAEAAEAIDFSRAVKLGSSGGSCECYKARLHRRKVFVKRLKPELRHHPRYVGALDKEYDVGVDLSHPGLPEYREFHGDFIVMDYIDGKTLAELISEKDPWLGNDANIRNALASLIDVVDYLHKRNVVHCDLKADNVMITNINRNLKLIDLGNAYTDWFTDTSGNPANYKLPTDDIGNPEMDFRGIGNIARALADGGFGKSDFLSRFRELCYKPGVTSVMLRNALAESTASSRSRWIRPSVLVVSMIALCLCGVWLFMSQASKDDIHPSPENDTVYVKPVGDNAVLNAPDPESPQAASVTTAASAKPAYEDVINSEMKGMVKPMLAELDKAEALVQDTAASVETLRETMFNLVDTYTSISQQSYSIFKRRYPEADPVKIELAVANSPAYQDMIKRHSAVSQKITDRIFEIQDK